MNLYIVVKELNPYLTIFANSFDFSVLEFSHQLIFNAILLTSWQDLIYKSPQNAYDYSVSEISHQLILNGLDSHQLY